MTPRVVTAVTGLGVIVALGGVPAGAGPAPAQAPAQAPAVQRVDCSAVLEAGGGRQADFAEAAAAADVPLAVVKAVSFMQSRWDDHGGAMSTSGGFGPMHLTDAPGELADGRGDGSVHQPSRSLQTLAWASQLTGLSTERLRADPAANICGGAAVLAALQGDTGVPVGAWAETIADYSGAPDSATALRTARQTFAVMREGRSRVTNDGERVSLAARPQVRLAGMATAAREGQDGVDCPRRLGCEWIPAPYEQYGDTVYDYGNHDLADRPRDLSIDYIIIHDTEATYETTLDLVTDPTYVSWQYSLRSADGHIAQHLDLSDVGWHAGNWYVNAHSIGLEHEGFAASGEWYTESMYRTSAALVRYLTERYDIPRDRAHIIGHDQIPGTVPSTVAGMHWDPGPYWDWEHYMRLVGAPIGGDKAKPQSTRKIRVGDVVTVKPGYPGNSQPMVGCEEASVACEPHGTNFVYLHQAPDQDAPLAWDEGMRPTERAATTQVSDIGARAAAGQQLVVAATQRDWLGVWWAGHLAWLHNPGSRPVVVRAEKKALTVAARDGLESVPVYGRAYPEQAAYPQEIPYQTVTPLQYEILAGQVYAVADLRVPTDYYYAKTFDDSIPMDHTVVRGADRYYQVWLGHRFAFVRAADVELIGR